jgi:hypothetical protein
MGAGFHPDDLYFAAETEARQERNRIWIGTFEEPADCRCAMAAWDRLVTCPHQLKAFLMKSRLCFQRRNRRLTGLVGGAA